MEAAWRRIGEMMTAVQTTKEKLVGSRSLSRCWRDRASVARAGCGESRIVFRARARGGTSAASKVLGTPRRNEHGAALARPGETAASARTAGSVYGWFTEGVDTLDLKEAKALLEELAS